jgi:hypothetical protein
MQQQQQHHQHQHHQHRSHHRHAHRKIGGQECCAIATSIPLPIHDDLNARNLPWIKFGRLLSSIQTNFFDAQQMHYPVIIFHSDELSIGKKRRLEEKTHSPVSFYKLDLSPHSLPLHLRRVFGSIVNSTAHCHKDGNLFLPELKGCTGFQTRLLNRFFAGAFFNHSTLRGYQHILRINSNLRFTSPILFSPFELASEKRAIFMFRSMIKHAFINQDSRQLLAPFLTHPRSKLVDFVYSDDILLYNMRHFQTRKFQLLFQKADRHGLFILGDQQNLPNLSNLSIQPNLPKLSFQLFQTITVSELLSHTRVQQFPVSLTLSHQP